ncbi:hypothetical protein Tco_0286121 [Tanacetum coccineum]
MIHKFMSCLDAYDEPIGDMEDKVDNPNPQSTLQVLLLFEVYTPPMTYPKEVDETIGIPMEVEPLDHTKQEDLGLNTCSHDLFLSSREISSVDESEPQLLPNFSPLDVNLGDKRGALGVRVTYFLLGRFCYQFLTQVSSLIPLSRGSFDVTVEMDWLSKRKFLIVCYEKVVRIPLEGDEIFRVHGEHTLGAAKALMNAKVGVIEEGETVLGDALSRKERVKLRRVRRMILTAQSEALKQENILAERLHGLDQRMERKRDESLYFMDRIWVLLVESVMDEAHASSLRYLSENEIESPWILSLNFQGQSNNSKEWNSGDDQLRLRWMIYLVVLADAAESTLEDIMRACVIDFGGSYKLSIRCAPFEALYGRKRRSHVLWAEIGGSSLIGPELVLETTDKVVLIKEKLKAARDRQKSYADKRRKPLEFEVGDRVLLRVSPWKGVVRFGKKGKLALRYVGPFEILERIGLVAYRLRLPEELNSVHDTFHVSNLKKCLADANLHVPLDEIKVDNTLRFVEEPIEIMDREIKKLKRSRIPLVKVRWNSKRGPEFTWDPPKTI